MRQNKAVNHQALKLFREPKTIKETAIKLDVSWYCVWYHVDRGLKSGLIENNGTVGDGYSMSRTFQLTEDGQTYIKLMERIQEALK